MGGANRIELCGNLGLGGGTTPSIGLLKAVKKAIPNVPIMVCPSHPPLDHELVMHCVPREGDGQTSHRRLRV
jgi:hypothetical protein